MSHMVCIYVDATLTVHPTLSFPLCVHKSMPYFCISIPALQIWSSWPTMEYYSAIKKEQHWVICSDVDERLLCHTAWSNPEREKQIPHINACIWKLP